MARGSNNEVRAPRQSFSGRFYAYQKGDQVVYAAWPKKRGKARSEAQQEAQDRFAEAIAAMNRHAAAFMAEAREQVKGTPFLPRDPILAALMGKGPQFKLPDGKRLINMATRVNMSEVMDNIAWEPGSMLYRDENLWKGIPPGQSGYVLTYQGENDIPQWLPAGGGTIPPRTLFIKSTTQATPSSWPQAVLWDSASEDELGIWNASFPERLYVPTGALKIRLGFQVYGGAYSSSYDQYWRFRRSDGVDDWIPGVNISARQDAGTASGLGSYTFHQGATPWFNPGDIEWYELIWNQVNAASVTPRAPSYAYMEAFFG